MTQEVLLVEKNSLCEGPEQHDSVIAATRSID